MTPVGTYLLLLALVPPDAVVWDVSQFSLVDGYLVPLGSDEVSGDTGNVPWSARVAPPDPAVSPGLVAEQNLHREPHIQGLYPVGRRDPGGDTEVPVGGWQVACEAQRPSGHALCGALGRARCLLCPVSCPVPCSCPLCHVLCPVSHALCHTLCPVPVSSPSPSAQLQCHKAKHCSRTVPTAVPGSCLSFP